jgi:hypothetical protein
MDLTTGDFAPADPATFLQTPGSRAPRGHAAPQLMGAQ